MKPSRPEPARVQHIFNLLYRRVVFFFICVALSATASLPPDWQYQQAFDVSRPGVVKLDLPIETLNAARPGLEDLRLYDESGGEVPYLIEHPTPAPRIVRNAKSFQTSLNPQSTVITLETGLAQPLDGITLETPANDFIKAVQIEGSADGRSWKRIAEGKPVFRQPAGASQLHLDIPPAVWSWVRLTVNDQRSQPIPFNGARVYAALGESAPDESVPVTLPECHESPGETRLTLNLPAANLNLSEVQIETLDPLFTRQVSFAVPQMAENSIHEQLLGGGIIYRIAIEGQPPSAQLSLPLETQVRSRELLMLIRNYDSPPLPITSVKVMRRPVYLVFLAKQPGGHYLLTGNPHCVSPRYDLAGFGANLKAIAVAPMKFSPFGDNPSYRPPELLPNIENGGVALDVSTWQFRKPIKVTRAGAQQLELDPDILSHAQPGLEDLRLMRNGKQVSYIVERTSIQRALTPDVTLTNDAKNPKLSHWTLKLSHTALPITRLLCTARTPLFQRELIAYEILRDERGETYQRSLGRASWIQTPGAQKKEFSLAFDSPPQSDTVFLETDNGDNPPVTLEDFKLFYPATRLLFKATSDEQFFLYYGNPEASSPQYDLNLVANQLLAAEKATASLGAQEQLRKSSWRENPQAGRGGVVFWSILGVVVVVLLVVISRLLPKSELHPPK